MNVQVSYIDSFFSSSKRSYHMLLFRFFPYCIAYTSDLFVMCDKGIAIFVSLNNRSSKTLFMMRLVDVNLIHPERLNQS